MNQAVSSSIKPGNGRRTIVLVFLACFLPILAASYLYFINPPETTNNYGTILDPQVPVGTEAYENINGEPFKMADLAGKWVLIQAIDSSCDKVCQNTLYFQRQARKTKGKEMYRIERVAFVTDNGPLDTLLLRQFPDVHFVRASAESLKTWLPLQGGLVGTKGSAEVKGLHDHVFMADPLGHVMMRFPPNESLVFEKFRKDISRLLWASNIG